MNCPYCSESNYLIKRGSVWDCRLEAHTITELIDHLEKYVAKKGVNHIQEEIDELKEKKIEIKRLIQRADAIKNEAVEYLEASYGLHQY